MPASPTRTSMCLKPSLLLSIIVHPDRNRTKHCWQNYVDYHKCILAKGEDFPPCRQVCHSLPSLEAVLRTPLSSSSRIALSALVLGVSGGMSNEVSLDMCMLWVTY